MKENIALLEVAIAKDDQFMGRKCDVVIEEFYSGKDLHRLYGPARRVIETASGDELAVEHFEAGNRHNFTGPAVKIVDRDADQTRLEWWYHGQRHRWDEQGPAVQIFQTSTGHILK